MENAGLMLNLYVRKLMKAPTLCWMLTKDYICTWRKVYVEFWRGLSVWELVMEC